MQFFPKLSEYIDKETFTQKIEPTLLGMIIDPVFMIREEASKTVIKLSKTIFDHEWLQRVIELKLNELARHERFMLRIQTIHLINVMKDEFGSDYINQVFVQHLLTLAEDPVPNIRFNVSQAIASPRSVASMVPSGGEFGSGWGASS